MFGIPLNRQFHLILIYSIHMKIRVATRVILCKYMHDIIKKYFFFFLNIGFTAFSFLSCFGIHFILETSLFAFVTLYLWISGQFVRRCKDLEVGCRSEYRSRLVSLLGHLASNSQLKLLTYCKSWVM